MTPDELVAAFHALPPEDQRRFLAEVLEPRRRGRPTTPYDTKLAKAWELIDRVDARRAELGSLEAAYRALATPERNAKTVERQHDAAKQFVELDSAYNIFNEFTSEG